MIRCTHFFAAAAAANSASSCDQSGCPWIGSMSRQFTCTATPLMEGLLNSCSFIDR
jgi:hypothetical protein